MKAYKGFNKDMTCRGFQFTEGETYHEDKAKLCDSGFHACEDPLDCYSYYAPGTSVYHEVELDEVSDERKDDSKVVGKTIKIGAEIDHATILKLHFEYVKSRTTNKEQGKDNACLSAQDWSSLSARNGSSLSARNRSSLSAQDWSSLSAQDGSSLSAQDGSSLSAQDGSSLSARNGSSLSAQDGSKLSAGRDSVLASFNSKAKAGIGSLIALAVRKWNGKRYEIKDFAAAIVDGDKIKADTWYTVKDGEFVEVEE